MEGVAVVGEVVLREEEAEQPKVGRGLCEQTRWRCEEDGE